MLSASKTTFGPNYLKILRAKGLKNLTNLPKKFCEFPLRSHLKNTRRSSTEKRPKMIFIKNSNPTSVPSLKERKMNIVMRR